jgi:hypothetical protein
VAGGANNTASGIYTTVGGGFGNTASINSATVAGGQSNLASGLFAAVGGGGSNIASGAVATIGGGDGNVASNDEATVGGGCCNTASGTYATVPGGRFNIAAGHYSFAAGRRARANHDGSFVWSDSLNADFASTAVDQFNVRAAGGTRIFSNSGLTAGVTLAPGGGSWSSVSDRNMKENFEPVDGISLLEKLNNIPLTMWNYKSQDASIRHLGPMAQDFYAAFGLGEEDTRISTVDADGVALAGVQALYQLHLEAIHERDRRISALQEQVNQLTQLIEQRLGVQVSNVVSKQ